MIPLTMFAKDVEAQTYPNQLNQKVVGPPTPGLITARAAFIISFHPACQKHQSTQRMW